MIMHNCECCKKEFELNKLILTDYFDSDDNDILCRRCFDFLGTPCSCKECEACITRNKFRSPQKEE